jgi:hypothetical protein
MPDQIGSQQPAGNPHDKPPPPAPLEPTIEQRVMALESKSHSHTDQQTSENLASAVKIGEAWLIGINGLLLVATIVIACIYYHQLTAMRESNRISRDAVVSVQRAFLNANGIDGTPVQFRNGVPAPKELAETGRGYRFTTIWENSGTTPAIKVLNYFSIDQVPPDQISSFPFMVKPGIQFQWSVVGPKATETAGTLFEPEDFWTPVNKGVHIYFWGWRLYRDIFPDTPTHLTEFCYEVSGVSKIPPSGLRQPNIEKALKENIPETFAFIQCPRHNCSDKDCEDYDALLAQHMSPPK